MNRELKAFALSTCLHAIIVISLFAVGYTMTTKTILIDFSIEDKIDTVKEEVKKASNPPRLERVIKGEKRIEPQQPVKEMVKNEVEPVKESPVTDTSSEEQAPVPAAPKKVSEASLQGLPGTGDPDIKEMKADSISGNAVSSSSMVDFTEMARQRYIKEHFTYIKEIITKNISYPYMARKMGWSGKVTVSFIITTDGSVRDVKIIESSGFDVLDRNTADTVRKVSPFPRPPVRAEVIVPVVYRLN